ncbi:hypothetical protein CT676_00725 [Bradyrhizobium sp. MOS001]|uniref:hypothetical protein n=1 Tax=unclassified Bradyrhizobium TaxID=2631580 RepID=UPI001074D309|nr:hypothetical protein [Bradyrhizobium sp. MOS001]TFW62683.1 hypothetical protein CT676_00725 [Bradyrhizobium sp. MOS001]
MLTAKFDSGSTRRGLFADNPRFLCKIALTDRIKWFAGDYEGIEDHAWPAIGATGTPRLCYAGRGQ